MLPKRILLRCCLALFAVFLWQVPATAAHAVGAAVTVNPQPPACASAGSTATANGSGYTAGQSIQIWVDQTQAKQTTPQTITVQSNGTWTASFVVPNMGNSSPATYPLYGIGSPDRASTPFCVGPPASGTLPAAPSGVKNVNYGALNFRITWTDNSNNETGFEIYNGNEIRTVGAGVTQYLWPAQPNQYMCIAVRAKNASGNSAWAGMWTCTTTPAGGQPKPPTNVVVTGYSTTALKISFVDQANNETAYQFWNSGETRTYNSDVQGTGSTFSVLWTGLQPHTWMCLKVRSYNEWGASTWSPDTTWACAYTLG